MYVATWTVTPHMQRYQRFLEQLASEVGTTLGGDWNTVWTLLDGLHVQSGLDETELKRVLAMLDIRDPSWIERLAVDAGRHGEAAAQRWATAWMLWRLTYPLSATS